MDNDDYKTYWQRERERQETRDEQHRRERSEYAFNEWMSGKSYDDAWDRFEEMNNGQRS